VLLNLVILAGIVRVFTSMRRGTYGEAELERQLANRGFFYRFFGRWMRAITKEWQMYPVGVVFGLGFDNATEVALLANGLALSDHMRAEQVKLDFPGDVGDAGLAGLAGGEVAGFLGLAGAGPVRAVPDEGGGGEDLQQERGEREIGLLRGKKPRRCPSRRPGHAGS